MALAGFVAALLAATLAVVSGLGHRWGWWDFGQGFTLLKYALYGSFGAAALSLVGAILTRPSANRRGLSAALAGIALSSVIALVPLNEMRKVESLPPIHDITTDTTNPPEFVAVLPLRGSESNSTNYAGNAIAELQRDAYPDIKPLDVKATPDVIFNQALAAVSRLGWELVDSDLAAGRIEATDTTLWFGFKDDVVIRITALPDGSRVDVRSVSRVGGSDVGANASRIRNFFRAISE